MRRKLERLEQLAGGKPRPRPSDPREMTDLELAEVIVEGTWTPPPATGTSR